MFSALAFVEASGQTIVSGNVRDANSGEPIPFANVYFVGTTIGASTDFHGNYKIETDRHVDSIAVRLIGYEERKRYVRMGVSQTINFQLRPSAYEYGEIVIKVGENPAFRIIREAQKNRRDNDRRALTAYDHESYTKIEIGLNNISEKFKNRRLLRPFKDILDTIRVASGEDGSLIFPIFFSESISRVYYLKEPERRKEEIKATKLTGIGLDDGSLVSQVIGSSFQQYNFYQNWMNILDKHFMSPIADGGFNFYEYYLVDSLFIGDYYCYQIEIEPKRKEDLAFTGTIWIHDTTFAIKRVSVNVGKDANLNFVNRISIQQELTQTEEGPWIPSQNRVYINMQEITAESPGVQASFFVSNRDIKVGNPRPTRFYEKEIEVEHDAQLKGDEYWDEQRHVKLTETEEIMTSVIDSVRELPQIKTYIDIADFIVSGYVPIGMIDIGPHLLFYGYNSVEGHRFRLGGRTNSNFNRNLGLEGYLAYGTKDEIFKYSAQIEYFINRDRWMRVGYQQKEDVEGLGVEDNYFEQNTLFAASTQIGLIDKMNRVYVNRLWFETDIFRGFSQRVSIIRKEHNPAGKFAFAFYPNPDRPDEVKEDYQTTEIAFESRFAHRERLLLDENRRISLGTEKFPIVSLRYTLGVKDFLQGDFTYHRASLSFTQKLNVGIFGRTDYNLTGTQIFAQLPFPLLNIIPGNETFIRSRNTFSLVNFFEFVNDRSVTLHVDHHFEGLVFNRIPLLKRLNWRLVTGGSVAYGSLNKDNLALLPERTSDDQELTSFYMLENGKPYIEVFYGIENIFRFIRIDAVHRLTYLENANARPFGVLGSVHFRF